MWVGKSRFESEAQEVIPMRKLIATAGTAAMMLALTAAPAMAQTTQDGTGQRRPRRGGSERVRRERAR